MTGPAFHLGGSAEQPSPFLDSAQSEPVFGYGIDVEADSVVANVEIDAIFDMGQADICLLCLTVAFHVVERFLRDAKQRSFEQPRQAVE